MEEHVSLKEFIEKVLDERDRQYILKFDSAKEALKLSAKEMERRLEGLNELREEVIRDRNQYVKQDILDSKHEALLSKVFSNEKRLTVLETRIITWSAAITLFLTILSMVLRFITF